MNEKTREAIMTRMQALKCPKCGASITYNGNYFCINWTYPYTGEDDTCDWALEHPQYSHEDKFICWVILGYWEKEDRNSYEVVHTRPMK